ncbi:MAG TPA: NAD-dependent epimerase/dehydratase family protein [Candidatus Acidoferrales bacterium]|nr:NAD-dependent epimerase/dehydratase family protein [Candidatus Acidoferrales bacterium]
MVGYVVFWRHNPNLGKIEAAFKALYLQNILLLVFVGVVFFALFGFYTHARTYQNRYKFVVTINVVTLTFLAEVLLYSYVLRLGSVPRGVMLLAWLFSLVMIVGSRVLKNYVTKSYSIARKPTGANRDINHVLVIGGAGYIGSVLSRKLLAAGYRVRVLDSLFFGDASVCDLVSDPNFELLRADFRHVESLVKAVQGIDAVIHLAALVGDPACTINGDLTNEINYAATRMLIEVCKGASVNRLIFASTCSVYGASEFLMDERSTPNPVSLYAETKLAAEHAILQTRSSTFHPTVLRLATVFGLSPRPRFDLVVNLLTAKAVQDSKIMIFNNDQWRPFIHVSDVARAFLSTLQAHHDSVSGEVFNVGSYKLNYSLGEVAEKIREQIPELVVEYKQNLDKRNYRVSFDKIHSYLGFVCTTSLEAGVEEIRKAIESGVVKNHRDSIFSNYEHLLAGNGDLLFSNPSVKLFTVLEPADANSPTPPLKAITSGALA